jgi:tetratricopeptide (TPR) repeat protein
MSILREEQDEAVAEAVKAATTHIKAGRLNDAAKIYNKVLSLAPDNLEALKGMAELASLSNQPHSALPIYSKILHEHPENIHALNNRGVILMSLGDAEASEFSFRKLLKFSPYDVEGLNNLGTNLVEQNRFDEAEEQFLQSIEIEPDRAKTYYNLGVLYLKKSPEDHEKQLEYYMKAVEFDPSHTDAHMNIANIKSQQNDLEQALFHIEKALLGRPSDGRILFNKGLALRQQRRYTEALDVFRAARVSFPEPHIIDFEVGNTHYEMGDLKAATALFMASVSARLSFKKGYLGLGKVLAETGRLSKAKEALLQAGEDFEVQQRLKGLDILTGDKDPWILLRESFEIEFEKIAKKEFKWKGDATTEPILIHTTGMSPGEIILFSRLAPALLEKGLQFRFVADPHMTLLLKRVIGIDSVSPASEFNPDKLTPGVKITHLYAIPSFLKLNNGELPSVDRYITPDTDRIRLWEESIFTGNEMRIGLNWCQKGIHTGPEQDLIFEEFEPIIRLQGATFINLTPPSNDTLKGHIGDLDVIDFAELIRDVEDFLAVINRLDLLITTDGLAAHLAGALGKPAIVLLPLLPKWYWGYKSMAVRYYPGHTLMRQAVENNWDRPIQRTIKFLQENYELK